ncbi:MAG TPA: 2-dehydropantoate 2-reductase [Solirubrobacteraceae bacterium]|nr:2-dehydropantoate 2-reductase [Solirubrobacteraceae bacterium]
MSSVAVLGPGGVGGFLAAALAHAGRPVAVVARESTAAVIAERGIALRSVRLGTLTTHPQVSARLTEPVDTLIVATKADGLREGLARVESTPQLVVPLLNGLDHMAVLRARFGAERVAAGAIRIEADRPEPGVIVQTSPFLRVDLAADHPAPRARLEPLKELLDNAEVPASIVSSEAQALWSKLVRLNALACTTSASGRQIGFIRTDPVWRARLEACIAEAAAVAAADGADVDVATTMGELDDAHAELGSSMQRDIAAGRPPELDAIAGAVLRAAVRHGLGCPTIAALAAEIADAI